MTNSEWRPSKGIVNDHHIWWNTEEPEYHVNVPLSLEAAIREPLKEKYEALLVAARGFDAIIQILDSGMTVLPFGTEGEHYDRALAAFQAAVADLEEPKCQRCGGEEFWARHQTQGINLDSPDNMSLLYEERYHIFEGRGGSNV